MDLDSIIKARLTENKRVIADNICKGKKMPIGTVSNGRKKIAEGKWVEVTEPKQKKKKFELDEKFKQLHKKHDLSRLPINVDPKDVVINDGSYKGSWILKWKDPKTDKAVTAYSRAFLKKNAMNKWKRIQNVSSKDIKSISRNATKLLNQDDPITSDAGAIVAIIAGTGLRPGSIKGFKQTKNRGVSTLAKKNIKIDGDTVHFEFIGKSYKNNTAKMRSKVLSEYLQNKMEGKKEDDFIFDTEVSKVRDVFAEKISPSTKIKLKDMRTYIATDIARKILMSDKSTPPPLPEKGRKKAIQKKLTDVFKKVSSALNNTPTMAKTSYIHPNVINEWLESLGVKEAEDFLMKSIEDSIRSVVHSQLDLDEDDEDVDEYPLPDWWDHSLDS